MKIFLNFCLKKKKNYRISLPFENRKIKAPTLLAWKIISIPINLRIILNSSDPSRLFPRLFHYKTRFANKSLLKFSLKISLKCVRIYARKNYYSIRLANCFNNNRAKRARGWKQSRSFENLFPLPSTETAKRTKAGRNVQRAKVNIESYRDGSRVWKISRFPFRVFVSQIPLPSPRAKSRGNKDSLVGEFFGGNWRGEMGLRSRLIAAPNSLRAINSNLCTSYPESRPFPATFREKKRVVGGRKGGKERRIEK